MKEYDKKKLNTKLEVDNDQKVYHSDLYSMYSDWFMTNKFKNVY